MKLSNLSDSLLSVGVPAFNQCPYLRATLESLLTQKIAPFEIVVSDNWSTDETCTILKEFEGRIRIIKPLAHLDMMEHWNFLVENLSGSWFALLSSDDVAKPNYVESLLRGIGRSEHSVLVQGAWEVIDGKGAIINKKYLLSVPKLTLPPQNFLNQLLGPKGSFAAFAAKKSAWVSIGGFNNQLKLCGDWGFWLSLAPYGAFIYENEIVSQYRVDHVSWDDLVKARLLIHIQDILYIYRVLIPNIAKKLKISEKYIYKISKIGFRNILILASINLKHSSLNEAVKILEVWAQEMGMEDDLRDLAIGKKFYSFKNLGRSLFRKIYLMIFSRSRK